MARLARISILGEHRLIHKIVKGHNSEWIFKTENEKSFYLKCLNEKFNSLACDFHAICMMSNHTHEIFNIKNVTKFFNFMRDHHGAFAQYYNKKHCRSGKVGIDRPKTKPIESENHEIISVLYAHTNPLRSKSSSLSDLKNYEFSTHLLYGYGIAKPWMQKIILPQWYLNLGKTDAERQLVYMYLVEEYMNRTEEKFSDLISVEGRF